MWAEVLCHPLYVRETLLKMACGKYTAWRVNTPNCVRDQWRANKHYRNAEMYLSRRCESLDLSYSVGAGVSRESSGGFHDTADYTRYVGKWSLVERMTCPKCVLNIQI